VITYTPGSGRVNPKGDLELVKILITNGDPVELNLHGVVAQGAITSAQKKDGLPFGPVAIGEKARKLLKLRNPNMQAGGVF